MATGWHMKPTAVSTGEAALAALGEAQQAREHYALAIVDARMPEMDGFTLVERIKSRSDLHQPTVIMLTSAGKVGDGARCRDLGVSGYLMKPVKKADLRDAIMIALGRPLGDGSAPSLITQHSLRETRRSLRILVAEDSPVNLKLVVRMLEKRGHLVVCALNGQEAIEKLEAEPFDVVLMDVQMPETDGLEATRIIRERERAADRRTPIVAMTAHAMKGDRERCLAAGMDGYISKPLRAGELFETISRLVPPTGKASKGTSRVQGGAPEVMDMAAATMRLEGDVELLKEIADVFLEQSPQLLLRIKEAAERGDSKTVERAAHTIKGSVSNFAAEPAYRAAQKLEEMGRHGDINRAGEACADLESEIERLKPALAALGRRAL
jgi:CheY-like chemotaxis protein